MALLPVWAGEKAAESRNSFGLDLFKKLALEKKEANLLISPFSISTALGMTYNGARRDTKKAMASVLGFSDASNQKINDEAKAILTSMGKVGGNTRLEVANALFANQNVSFKRDFLDTNKNFYDATARSLDFNSPQALGTINSFVSEKTHDKIPTIIDEIAPDAILYLINAIYFKGTWEHEFKKSATRDEDFHLFSGKTASVKMMHMHREDFSYLENAEFQAINLFYKDKRLSMFVFLPSKSSSLDKFEADLTVEKLEGWCKRFGRREGSLAMPRFKIEDKMKLKEPLSSLGMAIAFNEGKADFKDMADIEENIFISQVLHKTFMEVNEEGTEAAAVTAVEMRATSAMVNPVEPFNMVVDRPYFLALRDNETGSILFLGHVTKPGS